MVELSWLVSLCPKFGAEAISYRSPCFYGLDYQEESKVVQELYKDSKFNFPATADSKCEAYNSRAGSGYTSLGEIEEGTLKECAMTGVGADRRLARRRPRSASFIGLEASSESASRRMQLHVLASRCAIQLTGGRRSQVPTAASPRSAPMIDRVIPVGTTAVQPSMEWTNTLNSSTTRAP